MLNSVHKMYVPFQPWLQVCHGSGIISLTEPTARHGRQVSMLSGLVVTIFLFGGRSNKSGGNINHINVYKSHVLRRTMPYPQRQC